jgi:NAD-dependent deacetylase
VERARRQEAVTARRSTGQTLRRDLVDAVAQLLAKSKRALFITGAGMSADSGLPTYRGVGGLYNDKDAEDGVPIEVALSGEMLARRPKVTWRHIVRIEEACRGAVPNKGHQVIAAFEQRLEHCVVLTQNVDGLHRAAGSTNVIDIHGRIHHLRCVRCDFSVVVRDFAGLEVPPACPWCKSLVRPDVVLFGEALPAEPFNQLQAALEAGVDIVFTIGTTALFPYIARPVLIARAEGIPTVEINPGHTDLSDVVDLRIRSGAAKALAAIWASYTMLS